MASVPSICINIQEHEEIPLLNEELMISSGNDVNLTTEISGDCSRNSEEEIISRSIKSERRSFENVNELHGNFIFFLIYYVVFFVMVFFWLRCVFLECYLFCFVFFNVYIMLYVTFFIFIFIFLCIMLCFNFYIMYVMF